MDDLVNKCLIRVNSLVFIVATLFFLLGTGMLFPQSADAAPASNPLILSIDTEFTCPPSSSPNDSFSYELSAQHPTHPMPAGSFSGVYAFTVSGTSSVNLMPITYASAGAYVYKVAQVVASPQTGYIYDTEVFTVTVIVDNALQIDVVIQKLDSTKTGQILFTNSYAPLASDPSLMVDPPVSKTVMGNPDSHGVFSFKLEASDSSNPMPAGSSGGVKFMTIIGAGSEDFGTWSYTQAGTYYYSVSEIHRGESGYSYDTMVYTITDVVTDTNGQLVNSRTITNAANKPVSDYAFVNHYTSSATGIIGPKTGIDSLSGFYLAVFMIAGVVASCSTLYLIFSKNRIKSQFIFAKKKCFFS